MSIEAVAWAFKQPVTPSSKKFVLVALADYADDYGVCWPSYRSIMKKTSLSRRAVIDNCAALVKEGVIEKAGRIRGDASDTSNAYRLPIIEGCIDDHPLSAIFKSGGVQEMHPPVQEMHPPVQEMHPPSAGDAPHDPSYNLQSNQREREALTRPEFLRGVDGGYQEGRFDGEDFGHLTESEIKNQAEECWDRWGGNLKGRDPVVILRSWMRKGQSLGTVRKPSRAAFTEGASQVEQGAEPSNPLEDWHKRIEPLVGAGVFKSWIRALEWDGNGTVQAPNKFHADYVRDRFYSDITKILHDGVKIIPKPHQPERGDHT